MKHFRLREQAGAAPQSYGLGIKEVWEVSCTTSSCLPACLPGGLAAAWV